MFLGARLIARVPVRAWAGMAFAGTIGAMFGTPVAAALLLSETAGDPRISTWDRLFGPLVAAGAGAITTDLLTTDTFAVAVAPYTGPQPIDLLTGSIIAVVAAVVGLVPIYLFPVSYAIFQRLGTPLVSLIVGGLVLGILGAIGGPISLFKGLAQMQTLAANVGDYTAAGLALLVGLKLLAVVIASTSGFRGGRIFPVVFAGVAMGLCINVLFPSVPQALAVAASLLGHARGDDPERMAGAVHERVPRRRGDDAAGHVHRRAAGLARRDRPTRDGDQGPATGANRARRRPRRRRHEGDTPTRGAD